MAISTIRLQSLQSDSNLHKKTAISTIWQQFLQSDCNLHNRTAIYTIRSTATATATVNCNQTAISAIRLQSQQSDCNLHNQTAIFTINEQILPCRTYRGPHSRVCQAPSALFKTAISAIRLQSQQSDCNLSNQNKTPCKMPDTLLSVGACVSKLRNFCNLSNHTAISAIRL